MLFPQPIPLYTTANGIGDAVSALYAACGLADAAGQPVLYRCHHAEWLQDVSHPGVTIVQDHSERGIDMNGGAEGYRRQIATASSRCQAYCDNIAKALGIPPFNPTRPLDVYPTPQPACPPYIVLAPFSHHATRDWPIANWVELASRLTLQGYQVYAIAVSAHAKRLHQAFNGIAVITKHGQAARDTIALVLGAQCVVSNDSGLAHLAGMLCIPGVAVHAGSLPHDFLYGLSPTIRSVTSDTVADRADACPGLLASIGVDSVAETVALTQPAFLAQ